jgi:DNA-directed RNA polymerase omega subunit
VDERKERGTKDTLMYPLLEDLLKQLPSKYELVTLASLRAKQVIGKLRIGPTFEGEVDDDVKALAGGLKPLSLALREIASGKLDREKMYLLEYLESFRKGDETASISAPPESEFVFVAPEENPALPEGDETEVTDETDLVEETDE